MTIAAEGLLIACLLQFSRHRAERARTKAIELSRTDALTKLANRRVFEHALAEAAAPLRAESPTTPAGGLVLVDVDDFKAINTAGGHKSGDEVLRMIAAVLDGAIGGEATVCRIGGDEFAGIFPAGDGSDLARAAAKCRAAIGSVDWEVLCEPKVTVSIGCATWDYADAWKDIVVAADIALQTSKDGGKNAINSAPAAAPRLGPSAEQLRKRDSA
jgi:diguanylate cyclase (GGDEF)-like protein